MIDKKLEDMIVMTEWLQNQAYAILRRMRSPRSFDAAVTISGARQLQERLAAAFLAEIEKDPTFCSDFAKERAEVYREADALYKKAALDIEMPIREFENARTYWLECQSAFVDRIIKELKGYENAQPPSNV